MRKASALYLTILQVLLNSAPPCCPCRGHVVKESRGARLPFVSKHFYLFIAPAMKSISQVLSKGLLIEFFKYILDTHMILLHAETKLFH